MTEKQVIEAYIDFLQDMDKTDCRRCYMETLWLLDEKEPRIAEKVRAKLKPDVIRNPKLAG